LVDLRIAKRDLQEQLQEQQGQVAELGEQLIVLHQELLAAQKAAAPPEKMEEKPPQEQGLGGTMPQLSMMLAGPVGEEGAGASLQPDTPVVVAGQQSEQLPFKEAASSSWLDISDCNNNGDSSSSNSSCSTNCA
jgi:hypothetical protein